MTDDGDLYDNASVFNRKKEWLQNQKTGGMFQDLTRESGAASGGGLFTGVETETGPSNKAPLVAGGGLFGASDFMMGGDADEPVTGGR